jgi:hypothetical protein
MPHAGAITVGDGWQVGRIMFEIGGPMNGIITLGDMHRPRSRCPDYPLPRNG